VLIRNLLTIAICIATATTAAAQKVTPVPSKELCPNGQPRIVWNYPYEGGIPPNTTWIDCDVPEGCPVFPVSACLEMVDITKPVRGDRMEVVGPPPPAVTIAWPGGAPTAVEAQPSNPFGLTAGLPLPGPSGCIAGTGWDFHEVLTDSAHPGAFRASFEGWKGDGTSPSSPFNDFRNADLDFKAAPVYGNAVSIDRIRPGGWLWGMDDVIGGDYWTYSVPVNQHGDFWLSSLYRRYSWRQHPGDSRAERDVGTLTSPDCELHARYLTFRMSSSRSSAQRVELQVRGGAARDYFGIGFSGTVGDTSASGSLGHATQFTTAPPAAQQFPPVVGEWTVVRSVTDEQGVDSKSPIVSAEFWNRSEWMQTYVFDLAPFAGKDVRIRVVDDARSECVAFAGGSCEQMAPEHVNADYFLFTDEAPSGTVWMTFDDRQCGDVPGAGDGCSPVGRVPSEPPLWGVTDAHAHPMANLGFGGHVFWGDVEDSLQDVYNCTRSLPPLPGRPAISDPAQVTACYLAGDIVAVVGVTLMAGCTVLQAIPVIGLGVANICRALVAAASVVLLSTPVMDGLTVHGGQKFPSGAVKAGLLFSRAWVAVMNALGVDDVVAAFELGLAPQLDAWPDIKPTLGWYRDDTADDPEKVDFHSFLGLSKSHNMYQAEMIRRAYQGGMRLGVWDVVNSRALAFVADAVISSDWKALKEETDAAKRIVATSLVDIAAIAYSPEEAETIIRDGRMAVILGTEVDELGRMRPDGLPWPRSPHTTGDSMQKQIDDLWELGIRKITPVHAINNPIGGPAIFYYQYASNNHFLNSTEVDGEPSFFDMPEVRLMMDRSGWLPFDIILGDFHVFKRVGDDGNRPWNPHGWFNFDIGPHVLDGIVDSYEQVTYRLGQDKPKNNTLIAADGGWLKPEEVLGKQILVATAMSDLATVIMPVGHCNLINMFKPEFVDSFGPVIDAQYVAAPGGHLNAMGIFRSGGNDGDAFLRAAMKKGMILDADHMSQRMRVDAYKLAADYAREAGWPAGPCAPASDCGDYPFMGVHTTVRALEKEGGSRADLRGAFGSNDESTRTPKELRHVAANGGTVGVFPRGSAFIPPNTSGGYCTRDSDCAGWKGPGSAVCNVATTTCALGTDTPVDGVTLEPRNWQLPPEVENDCDLSSKSFAVKYLWLMRWMGGRGLTLTSDLNGLIGTLGPRFGGATPGKKVCGGDKRNVLEGPGRAHKWQDLMIDGQRHEHSGVWYDDYHVRGTSDSSMAAGWTDPHPTPHKRWRQVIARGQAEVREDSAPRHQIDELVYFNDHGLDVSTLHWYDQGANAPGAQLWPMKKWNKRHAGWDFNLDGFQHIGLLPDLLQDMRNVGVQWEQMAPLFRGSQDYIDMWRRAAGIGFAHP
jgi:hypothetical protein